MYKIVTTLCVAKSASSFEVCLPFRQRSFMGARKFYSSVSWRQSSVRWKRRLSYTSDGWLFSCSLDLESSPSEAGGCIDENSTRALFDSDVDFECIDALIQKRSLARWEGNYKAADDLKVEIDNRSAKILPSGYELFLQDIPRKSGGGSRWTLVPTTQLPDEDDAFWTEPRILQLAHTAMGLAVHDNQQPQTKQRQRVREESLTKIVETAKARLEVLLEETRTLQKSQIDHPDILSTKQTMVRTELGGRTAADAALWFALAGSKDESLFRGLADVVSWELGRFGQRPSCKAKNIYQILERFAAAGLKEHPELERVAHESLLEKEVGGDDTTLPRNHLNLHSDRSLLLIWKFATKQKKQRAFLRTAQKNWEEYATESQMEGFTRSSMNSDTSEEKENIAKQEDEPLIGSTYNWEELFECPSRPLVVDVGCGMGVSLLGLASTTDEDPSEHESARLLLGEGTKWSDCNFVGVDLGGLGIEYGRGVAHRWNIGGKNLHLAIDAAEDFCQQLHSYPGEIRSCMIQFPTPFRLENTDSGNSQLPSSKVDGFMVTKHLLETIHSSLDPTRGRLLLQSNCEDVAVWMRNLACQSVGFISIDDDVDHTASISDAESQRIPQRTRKWIEMGGERAEGQGWYRREILHRKGATETEVTCAINASPVHRCLLKVNR